MENSWSLRQLAGWTNSQIFGRSQSEVDSWWIDSRKVKKGGLFVALPGQNTDGHLFVEKALKGGAQAVLVAKKWWQNHYREVADLYPDRGFLVAEYPLTALQKAAAAHLGRFPYIKKIAVTGSNGKTTTKELLGALLSHRWSTFVSPGNFNSDIGLPLALFSVRADHRCAVVEMGMNRAGEIAELCGIYGPRIGIITHIGTAHIGQLGSRQAIAREKACLPASLPADGDAFFWQEEPYWDFLKAQCSCAVHAYGVRFVPGLTQITDLALSGWRFKLGDTELTLPLIGEHNLRNGLAALRVALFLGEEPEQMARAWRSFAPVSGRSQIIKGDLTLIVDCYNANLESFAAALMFIKKVNHRGRRVLVAGSMAELGDKSEESHRELGRQIVRTGLEALFFLGEDLRPAHEIALSADQSAFWFADYDELASAVKKYVCPGDLILIKGSRTWRLERLKGVLV